MNLGSIVFYRLSLADAAAVNRRRADAEKAMDFHRMSRDGSMIHVGNRVSEGQVYPMIVTRLVPHGCNGQVMLDGTDTLWVTAVAHGEHCGEWLTTEVSG